MGMWRWLTSELYMPTYSRGAKKKERRPALYLIPPPVGVLFTHEKAQWFTPAFETFQKMKIAQVRRTFTSSRNSNIQFDGH